MKKRLFIVSLAISAMVSCTNDEVVQVNKGQGIEFRTALETRAVELTQDNLTEFYVTALTDAEENYFTNVEFSKQSSSNFVSADRYYWPATGDLNFFAYYPSAEALNATISIDKSEKSLTGYTPAEDIKDQLDFVTAKAIGNKADNANGMALEFYHRLSQIQVMGVNSNKGYEIKVKAIRIRNVAKSGDFDFNMSSWTPSEELTFYEVGFDTPIALTGEAQSLMSDKGNAMLIPQTCIAWGPEAEDPQPAPTAEGEPENGEGNGAENGDGTGDGTGDGGEDTPTTPVTDPDGSYFAFLVQVKTATGVPVYPLVQDETDDVEDYAWVAQSIAFNWIGGYKYIYSCDFSEGIGVVAPDNPTPGPEDPTPKPGEDILGGKISIHRNSLTFDSWSYETYDSSIQL